MQLFIFYLWLNKAISISDLQCVLSSRALSPRGDYNKKQFAGAEEAGFSYTGGGRRAKNFQSQFPTAEINVLMCTVCRYIVFKM